MAFFSAHAQTILVWLHGDSSVAVAWEKKLEPNMKTRSLGPPPGEVVAVFAESWWSEESCYCKGEAEIRERVGEKWLHVATAFFLESFDVDGMRA